MENIPTRLNNPGDIKDPSTGTFRQFNSPQEGYAALLNDLHAKQTGTTTTGLGPSSTLADFAKVYAPPGDNNNSAKYAADLANKMGVAPDSQLHSLDIGKWADAISGNEGYKGTNTGYNPKPFSQPQGSAGDNPGAFNYSGNTPNTTPQAQQSPGGIMGLLQGGANILKSAEAPFLGLAATPWQLLAKGLGQDDPFKKGIGGGEAPGQVSPLGLENKLGDAAQVASYAVPGAEGLGAIAGAGASGLLQGAGSAMSQGKGLTDVATEGAGGALAGGVTAGLFKGAGAVLKGIGGKTVEDSVNGIKNAYSQALNLHAGERALENRTGKDLAQVLVDHQAPLSQYADGTLDTSGAIPKLQAALDPLNKQAEELLSKPQGVVKTVNLEDVVASMDAKIDKMTLPEADKIDAKKLAASYLVPEAKKYGVDVAPDIADKIKQGFWASTFDKNRTQVQNHIPYLLGKQMQEATEKAVEGTDADISLHALNAQRSDLIDAIRRLGKLDGVRKLKGGRLGNMMGGVVGSIAGSGMGPLGALGGDYFGTKASEFMNNPATRIAIARAKAKATGAIPSLLSDQARSAANKAGSVVGKSSRPAGLLANLISNPR